MLLKTAIALAGKLHGSDFDSESSGGSGAVQLVWGKKRFRTSELQLFVSSKTNLWYTPSELLHAVKRVMPVIELDPCSDSAANERVMALSYIDEQTNGLAVDWKCKTLFMNAPRGLTSKFGTGAGAGRSSCQANFLEKLIFHYERHDVKEAICVVKASIGYAWFFVVWSYPVCILKERLCFVAGGEDQEDEGGCDPHGSVVVYFGKRVKQFASVFKSWGKLVNCG